MKRKFTPAEYTALQNFAIAAHECREIDIAAHTLHSYRTDLEPHILEYAFDDAKGAIERLNKAFDAIRPIFQTEQDQKAA